MPPSVEKAAKDGMREHGRPCRIDRATIPHAVEGHFGAAHVVLVPAAPGTGVIAGAAVRAVCEAAGIHDILTKSFGSNNPVNSGQGHDRRPEATADPQRDVERLRGVSLS